MELLLLLAAGLYLYNREAQKFLKDIRVKFIDIKLDWSKSLQSLLSKVYFKVTIDLINTTDFEGKLLTFYSDVYFEGKKIGTVSKSGEVQFNKKATTQITVPVYIATANIISSGTDALQRLKSGDPINITLKGYADVTAGRIEFTSTQTLKV